MEIRDYIALGALLATFIVFIFQVHDNAKQVRLKNFTTYTKRYQDIFLNLPIDIDSDDFGLKKLTENENTLRWLRAYFDLCSEECNSSPCLI
ncbi:MAG: hypothetical protein J5I90_02915 [Caldilineales bacterium]|nr:hypothetical protein [Caldilineales bacterium]